MLAALPGSAVAAISRARPCSVSYQGEAASAEARAGYRSAVTTMNSKTAKPGRFIAPL